MNRRIFQNNVRVFLGQAISPSDTQIHLVYGHGALLPDLIEGSEFYTLTIFKKPVAGVQVLEIIDVTAKIGDVLTVVRGREDTLARAFVIGDYIEMRLTAKSLTEFRSNRINGGHAASTYGL